MNKPAPMLLPTASLWTMAALLVLAGLLVLWSVLRPKGKPAKRKPKSRHHVVSWRVLWWRTAASPDAVRREIAPLEVQLSDLAPLARYFDDQAQADAEEGDHAGAR